MTTTHEVPLDANHCAIAFLGDVSGSMSSFNTKEFAQSVTTIVRENCDDGKVTFYGATFSDRFDIFADGVDGSTVEITAEQLKPCGLTALIPAIGRMIKHVGSSLADMTESRPGKVIFIILSDGEQTVSMLRNRIDADEPFEGHNGKIALKDLIDEHQNIWKWSFMFMGTNFDSISTGASFGLSAKQCINFANSDRGIQTVMECASKNLSKIKKKAAFRINTLQVNGCVVEEDDDDGFDDAQRHTTMIS